MVASFAGLASNHDVSKAEAAIGAHQYIAAGVSARAAQRWAPWSYQPSFLQAQAALAARRPAVANAEARVGIHSGGEHVWDIWLILAATDKGTQRAKAAATAELLNPLAIVQP